MAFPLMLVVVVVVLAVGIVALRRTTARGLLINVLGCWLVYTGAMGVLGVLVGDAMSGLAICGAIAGIGSGPLAILAMAAGVVALKASDSAREWRRSTWGSGAVDWVMLGLLVFGAVALEIAFYFACGLYFVAKAWN